MKYPDLGVGVEEGDVEEEEEEEVVDLKKVMIVSREMEHMQKFYEKTTIPAVTIVNGRCEIQHFRCFVFFSSRGDNQPKPIFEQRCQMCRDKTAIATTTECQHLPREINIVALGVPAWYIHGDVPVEITFKDAPGIPRTEFTAGRHANPGVLCLPHTGENPFVNQLIFEAKPDGKFNNKFPHYRESDAERGVEQLARNKGLPVPTGPEDHTCPLAQYYEMITNGGREVEKAKHGDIDYYVVSVADYKKHLIGFKSCVSDGRLKVNRMGFQVEATPLQPRGEFKCSLYLDVYYS